MLNIISKLHPLLYNVIKPNTEVDEHLDPLLFSAVIYDFEVILDQYLYSERT